MMLLISSTSYSNKTIKVEIYFNGDKDSSTILIGADTVPAKTKLIDATCNLMHILISASNFTFSVLTGSKMYLTEARVASLKNNY
jgi:hypothetical protein